MVVYVSGNPYNPKHGSLSSGNRNHEESEYQQSSLGIDEYNNNQYNNQGHGGNLGHGHGGNLEQGHGRNTGQGLSGNLGHGHGSNLGNGYGGNLGHGQGGLGQGSFGSGSRHQQNQFESGSQGGGRGLSVTSGFSNTRVEGFDTESQSIGGGTSGFQQSGGHSTGLGSGQYGGRHHGGSVGSSGSEFGAQTSGQKGFAIEQTSGYTSVNKNQGGFQNNQRGSTLSSSGGYGGSSRY